jgi:hypothetical protein
MSTIRAPLATPSSLATEPILAWRTWTLAGSREGDDVRLLPIAGDGKPWPVREPARAACHHAPRHHVVPGFTCRCGLHATHAPDLLRRTRDPAVLGTVALWGRVVEHEHGFRAELGYPQRLRLVCYLCFWRWGEGEPGSCEVVARQLGGRMVPLCEPHLELSLRYGYRVGRLLPADLVEQVLLSTYAVDVLRFVRGRSPSPVG